MKSQSQKNQFVVTIPIKPYVKRYIEVNFGLPANFENYPKINSKVRRFLRKPNTRFDKKYNDEICTYTEKLEVVISQDYFYRYGWEISKTDTVEFCKTFEFMLKEEMLKIVSIYFGLTRSIKLSIERYQTSFNMEEEYWPYESIKKEYYRNGPKSIPNFYDMIFKIVEEISVEIVSRKRDTFTKQKKEYDTEFESIRQHGRIAQGMGCSSC